MFEEQLSSLRHKAALRTRARSAAETLLLDRYAGWRRRPVEPRTVLYEAFAGNGVLDNPEAIFRYLLTQPDMSDLTHVWALADPGTFPAPANTGLAFNSANLGMTRLDATLQASTAFRLGIFDYRSDGRPDYR